MHQRGAQTRDSQLIYLSQWLTEFSDIEKDDFLQQLLDLYAPGQLSIVPCLAPLKRTEDCPSLFECRMDLLKEWFESWSEGEEREELLTRIREADSEFFDRFEKSRTTPNEDKIVEEFWLKNGFTNGDSSSVVVPHTAEGQVNGHETSATIQQPAQQQPVQQVTETEHHQQAEENGLEAERVNGTSEPNEPNEPPADEQDTQPSHAEPAQEPQQEQPQHEEEEAAASHDSEERSALAAIPKLVIVIDEISKSMVDDQPNDKEKCPPVTPQNSVDLVALEIREIPPTPEVESVGDFATEPTSPCDA